jgi:uncharacterized protein YjbJ (UPF0337 family)
MLTAHVRGSSARLEAWRDLLSRAAVTMSSGRHAGDPAAAMAIGAIATQRRPSSVSGTWRFARRGQRHRGWAAKLLRRSTEARRTRRARPVRAIRERRLYVNTDILEGKWKQMRGQMKEWWGKLTDQDIDVIAGKRDKLIGALQEKYGWAKRDAENEVSRRLREMDEESRLGQPDLNRR